MKSSRQLPYFMFVAGMLTGLAVGGLWLSGSFSRWSMAAPDSQTALPRTLSANATTTNALTVKDQTAGETVSIDSVTAPSSGIWIAVRDTNGQDLGNVLGAVRASGPRTGITVTLLRATVPGERYAVELYRDDGGDAFDPAKNSVYVDSATGNPVIAYFSTTR